MLEQSSVRESAGWATDLPEGGIKTAALRRVAADCVDENPQAAAEWATTLVAGVHGACVIGEVNDEWAEVDPATAVTWLTAPPNQLARR